MHTPFECALSAKAGKMWSEPRTNCSQTRRPTGCPASAAGNPINCERNAIPRFHYLSFSKVMRERMYKKQTCDSSGDERVLSDSAAEIADSHSALFLIRNTTPRTNVGHHSLQIVFAGGQYCNGLIRVRCFLWATPTLSDRIYNSAAFCTHHSIPRPFRCCSDSQCSNV